MINYTFPLFNAIDGLLVGWLPTLFRVLLWGALTGVVTLFLYAWVSDQQGLASLKQQTKLLRKRMMDPDLDRDTYMQLTKQNLSVSFRLLGKSFGPAMISSIPVLIMLVWLSTYYSYTVPPSGSLVGVTADPPASDLQFTPAESFTKTGDGMQLIVGAGPTSIRITDAHGVVYEGTPEQPPTPFVHQRQWWNALLSNEAGFVRTGAAVEKVSFAFPTLILLPSLPNWGSTWELPFFVALFIAALIIKFTFKIE